MTRGQHAADVLIECGDGTWFDVGKPTAAGLPPTYTIGEALALINRFCGHSSSAVNVAGHSLRVAVILRAQRHGPATVLGGLLHDAAEAFVGDVPAPVKRVAGIFREIETGVQRVIAERYGLHLADLTSPAVDRADRLALADEARRVMPSRGNGWGLPSVDEMPPPAALSAALKSFGPSLERLDGDAKPSEFASAWTAAVHETHQQLTNQGDPVA